MVYLCFQRLCHIDIYLTKAMTKIFHIVFAKLLFKYSHKRSPLGQRKSGVQIHVTS